MRLFVSVPMPKEVKDYLYDLQKKVKSKHLAKVNWVHKKNLHLTLRYLGEVKGSKEVVTRLKEVKFKKFKARLDVVGVFPSEREVRVVFVACEPSSKFKSLSSKVDEATLGLGKNEHTFVSHVTLGRVKNVKKSKEFISLIKGLDVDKLEFQVDSFVLMKSVLRREGPSYSVIEEYSLD